MPSLLDFLKDRQADELLIGTEAGWMSAGDLQRRAHLLRSEAFKPLRGQTVSLLFSDPIDFVEALTALDGWASGILLCDARIESGLLKRFEGGARAAWRVQAGAARPITDDVVAVQRVRKESTRWVIPTSGTTGEPKLVSHTLASLCRTVKSRSKAAESLIWGLLYEPTRFAGLQVLLQALGGGGSVIVPRHMHLVADVELLARLGCTALSATPSFWRKLAFGGLLERLSLRTVTLEVKRPTNSSSIFSRLDFPRPPSATFTLPPRRAWVSRCRTGWQDFPQRSSINRRLVSTCACGSPTVCFCSSRRGWNRNSSGEQSICWDQTAGWKPETWSNSEAIGFISSAGPTDASMWEARRCIHCPWKK